MRLAKCTRQNKKGIHLLFAASAAMQIFYLLLILRPAGLRFRPLPARLFGQLNVVGLDDGRDQPGKALVDFGATGGVAHLHALAFAAIKR